MIKSRNRRTAQKQPPAAVLYTGLSISFLISVLVLFSGCSSMKAARIERDNQFPPPQAVRASEGTFQDKIELRWDSEAPHISYFIYRADTENGSFERIVNTRQTFYIDRNLDPGTIYWYRVSTADAAGEQEGEASLPVRGDVRSFSQDMLEQLNVVTLPVQDSMQTYTVGAGEERWFRVNAAPSAVYSIFWSDKDSLSEHTADIQISAAAETLDKLFFSRTDYGEDAFSFSRTITVPAEHSMFYVKIDAVRSQGGSFGLKVVRSDKDDASDEADITREAEDDHASAVTEDAEAENSEQIQTTRENAQPVQSVQPVQPVQPSRSDIDSGEKSQENGQGEQAVQPDPPDLMNQPGPPAESEQQSEPEIDRTEKTETPVPRTESEMPGVSVELVKKPIYGGTLPSYPPLNQLQQAQQAQSEEAAEKPAVLYIYPEPAAGFTFSGWDGRDSSTLSYSGNGRYRLLLDKEESYRLEGVFAKGPLKKPMKQVIADGSFFISDIQAAPGTIWTVFYDDETDLLKLMTSNSQGDSWNRPVPIADAGYYFSDTLFDTAAGEEHLYLAYYSDADQSLNFLKTDVSGNVPAQRKLFTSPQFNEPVSITIDGDRIYIVSADIRSSGFDVSGSIFLMQSDDGGDTWNQRQNLLTIGEQVSSLDPYNIDTAVDSRGNLIIAVSRVMKDSSYATRIYSRSPAGELNDITPEEEFYAGSNAGKGIALRYFFDTLWFVYVNAESHAYDLLTYDGNQWEMASSVPVNEETQNLKIPELLVTHSAVLLTYSEEILDPPSISPVCTIAVSFDDGKTFADTFNINPESKALSRFGLAWDGSYIYSLHIEQNNRKSSKSLIFLRSVKGKSWE